MNLQPLVYSPLKEEEQSVSGWSKETVDYINNNRSRVIKVIKGIAKGKSRKQLQASDVDDIYSEILMYMYKSDDYNIAKAVERSSNGTMVSLEGYVNSCIRFCVIRYITTKYKLEKDTVREFTEQDGKELSIFDTLSDGGEQSYEDLMYDIDEQCKVSEYLRYKFGPDIYMLWYVRILTMLHGKGNMYKDILTVLGVSKKDLENIEKNAYQDDTMRSFARCVSNCGLEKSIDIIENYVYSANNIKNLVIAC